MSDLLDTNVLSELRKPRPKPSVLRYISQLPARQRFVSSVSLAELRFGIEQVTNAGKRSSLETWLVQEVRPMFAGRTLPLGEDTLVRWRMLIEAGRKRGHTFSQPDLFLAATALEHNLTLVTRNVRDFAGIENLKLLNPWDE